MVPALTPSAPRPVPVKAGGSPGPAAGAGLAAAPGSAESPAACSGTGADPAGIPRGSLLLAGGKGAVRHHPGLPEVWGGWDESGALTADTPHAHLPIHSPASVASCSGTWLSWTEPCSGSGLPGIPCQGSYLVQSTDCPLPPSCILSPGGRHVKPLLCPPQVHPFAHVQAPAGGLSWLEP